MIFRHLLILLLPIFLFSQKNLFEKKEFIVKSDTLKYRILAPLDYDENKKYPVHLFLHGAGERGGDNELQLIHGAELFLKKSSREKFKSWVIFPQSPKNDWWGGHYDPYKFDYDVRKSNALNLVVLFMDKFINRNDVDSNRVYVTGLSMGGMGTYAILAQRPDMFAAATPICGDGNPNNVSNFAKKVPVWIFHGSLDKTVLPQHSLKMANSIIKNGGNPRITFYENVNHNSWDIAFAEKDFLKWIHSKTKKNEYEAIIFIFRCFFSFHRLSKTNKN